MRCLLRRVVHAVFNVLRRRRRSASMYRGGLIVYVLRRGPMGRRRLMKLLFLIDRELCRRYCVAAFRWKLYKYGPVSRDVYLTLDGLLDGVAVAITATDEDIVYELTSVAYVDVSELPQEVKEVADQVLETWTRRSFDDLIAYVYSLEEVKTAWPGKRLLC
jgi:hypothetical protein